MLPHALECLGCGGAIFPGGQDASERTRIVGLGQPSLLFVLRELRRVRLNAHLAYLRDLDYFEQRQSTLARNRLGATGGPGPSGPPGPSTGGGQSETEFRPRPKAKRRPRGPAAGEPAGQ